MNKNSTACHLYVINANACPKTDHILTQWDCSGCEHYKGFEKEEGQPCIKCSFYEDIQQKESISVL